MEVDTKLRWDCPECDWTIGWSYLDLAECGGPVCEKCSSDMVLDDALRTYEGNE